MTLPLPRRALLAGAALLAAPHVRAQAAPLTIGFITTLSTPAGYIGEDIRDAFQLAMAESEGKLGGVPVALAFGQPPPQAIALDATSVYYTAGADVVAVNKLGGPLQVLAVGVTPGAIAVDSS